MPKVYALIFKFITGRNEVVAKVMFLHVSVILLTGGVSGEHPPPDQADPREGEPPPDQGGTPPPPGTRQTPPAGRTPPPAGTGRTSPSPGKKTAAYGQWAAGTHPTGMHSCIWFFLTQRIDCTMTILLITETIS